MQKQTTKVNRNVVEISSPVRANARKRETGSIGLTRQYRAIGDRKIRNFASHAVGTAGADIDSFLNENASGSMFTAGQICSFAQCKLSKFRSHISNEYGRNRCFNYATGERLIVEHVSGSKSGSDAVYKLSKPVSDTDQLTALKADNSLHTAQLKARR
jgi:hypothetical protein